MTRPSIRDVSDTARWVAVYRARESARPDALFDDRLAGRLAGAEGEAMADAAILPRGARNHWPTVVRTKLIDELILDSLAQGCDRVINLAAGLDTRPFRLPIPSETIWYEADLPALLGYKDAALADETPHCARITRPVDITDAAACADFLATATDGARRALVLTEGLLPYLVEPQVRVLHQVLTGSAAHWWIMDHWSPTMLRAVNATMGRGLGSARWRFAASLDIFEGWSIDAAHSVFRAAARWKRSPAPLRLTALLPDAGPHPRVARSRVWSGAVRLGRADREPRA